MITYTNIYERGDVLHAHRAKSPWKSIKTNVLSKASESVQDVSEKQALVSDASRTLHDGIKGRPTARTHVNTRFVRIDRARKRTSEYKDLHNSKPLPTSRPVRSAKSQCRAVANLTAQCSG